MKSYVVERRRQSARGDEQSRHSGRDKSKGGEEGEEWRIGGERRDGNWIARGTRVSTYRRAPRVSRGSNQAGIHRICCQPAAHPPPPACKCIIGPRVRVTRRAMTRESTPRKSGNPWSRPVCSARFQTWLKFCLATRRGGGIKSSSPSIDEMGGITLVSSFRGGLWPFPPVPWAYMFMEALMDRWMDRCSVSCGVWRGRWWTRRRIMRYPLEES